MLLRLPFVNYGYDSMTLHPSTRILLEVTLSVVINQSQLLLLIYSYMKPRNLRSIRLNCFAKSFFGVEDSLIRRLVVFRRI